MENAYESPIQYGDSQNDQSGSTTKAPTGLMILAILCIVFGTLGLLQATCGSVFFVFQDQFNELQAQGPDADLQKEIAAIQAGYQIPNIVLTVLNFIVAPLLIIGGIGCLRRSGRSRGLFRNALLLAAGYVLVRTVFGVFMQVNIMGPMQAAIEKQVGGAQAEATGTMIMAIFIGSAVAGVLWALATIVFYLWGWSYLDKKHVKEYLGDV
jgi:predicted small integral membrane protein